MFKKGLDSLVQDYERQVLSQAYLACGKNATRTAELLKISRQMLNKDLIPFAPSEGSVGYLGVEAHQ